MITIRALGPTDLGRIFFLSEFAVAVAGWVLEINPYDQPNVQEAKDNTNRVLKEGSPGLEAGSLSELTEGLEPPAYLAIMGYLPYSDETEAAVARLRAAAIERYQVATTWGYGPRFLHSTGQFHKGGPKTGRFLQIVDEPAAGPRGPRRALHLRHADPSPGGRRSADAAQPRPPAVRVTVGDIDASRSSSRHADRIRRASARWAATWSIASSATRTTRSSRSTRTRTPSRPPRATGPSARPRSRSSSPSSTRRAWSG